MSVKTLSAVRSCPQAWTGHMADRALPPLGSVPAFLNIASSKKKRKDLSKDGEEMQRIRFFLKKADPSGRRCHVLKSVTGLLQQDLHQ